MLVTLGHSYAPHRAWIVQVILRAHGVESFVWSYNMAHVYGTVFGGCPVMVDDEDENDAIEILNAVHEALPADNEFSEPPKPTTRFPSFMACFMVAIMGYALISIVGFLLICSFNALSSHGGVPEPLIVVIPAQLLVSLFHGAVFGLIVATLIQGLLLPLRFWRENSWRGLISFGYVFFLIIIFFAVLPFCSMH